MLSRIQFQSGQTTSNKTNETRLEIAMIDESVPDGND